MLKIIATAAALSFVGISFVAAAETKEVTRTVTVYGLDDAPALRDAVKAICADKSVKLSDKAKKACETSTFPTLTKALKFRNAGIGAEFNTLANQR